MADLWGKALAEAYAVVEDRRAAHLNALVGRPYKLGASGPDEFDCYGLARHLQATFYGREMPRFEAPASAGRIAISFAISVHPERSQWVESVKPVDGAIVTMAKQTIGYHMGTYIDLDGGLICHTLEDTGVIVEKAFNLSTMGWRKLNYWTRKASDHG